MIPNLVYGKGVSGALAYVMGQGNDPNDRTKRIELVPGEPGRATVLGGQNIGFGVSTPEGLDLARRVMEWQALPENQGSKTRNQVLDCLHASLSWELGQTPSREEMREAAAAFLKAIGLEKARAVFVAHDDTDHPHIHIVASRIDPETGKTLRVDFDKQAAQKWALDWEQTHGQQRQRGQNLHALREAIERGDVDGVLGHLTRNKATFQEWELNRALQYGGLDGEARDRFRAEIIGHKNTIGLRETQNGEVTRYTTRETLAAEMGLQQSALRLEKDGRHGLGAKVVEKASRKSSLTGEQDAALRRLTGGQGFSMLWGEAGTGKSHVLNAVRSAYEGAGKTVIGLAWTNDVAQQMHRDGFSLAGTIASQLHALDKGTNHWTRDTVLIVDEAAMIATEHLARLAGAATLAGAKLILAGDDKQLASIERGGMFETLRLSHGAAILSEVQRVKDPPQRAAFGQMHKGSFTEALKTFDKAGWIHWTHRQSGALREMAAKYTSDVSADLPAGGGKKRFMFAYTNKDVATLNVEARALHQARGDLGIEQTLLAKDGPAQFAKGDRIQFTGTARDKGQKRAGLTNGRVGSVESITFGKDHKPRVTVALDVGRKDKPQSITFTVGEDERAGDFNAFKHGYAGTIYRGQGRTLDYAYVAHTAHWRASAAYVALTRHREQVHIFAARETVKDLDAMAKSLARSDDKRAATAYQIDPGTLKDLAKELESRRSEGQAPAPESTSAKVERRLGTSLEFTAKVAERLIEGLAEGTATLLGGRPGPRPINERPRSDEAPAKGAAGSDNTRPATASQVDPAPLPDVAKEIELKRSESQAPAPENTATKVERGPRTTPETTAGVAKGPSEDAVKDKVMGGQPEPRPTNEGTRHDDALAEIRAAQREEKEPDGSKPDRGGGRSR